MTYIGQILSNGLKSDQKSLLYAGTCSCWFLSVTNGMVFPRCALYSNTFLVGRMICRVRLFVSIPVGVVLVLDNEKLYIDFQRDLPKDTSIVRLPKSGGVSAAIFL